MRPDAPAAAAHLSPIAHAYSPLAAPATFPTTHRRAPEPGPRPATASGKAPVKLLTNVEKLRLLTKARVGLLSAAKRAGLLLSVVERLGLLSKAEELGALSAATDPGTPGALLSLALPLLATGPTVMYLVPEGHAWQVALQAVPAFICIIGGTAAVAASTFVSRLQGSSG